MITFSLNTFIKISLLDTGGRISEIQRRLAGPGGYDFYKPLQSAVRAYSSGDKEGATRAIEAPTKLTERKYNASAFETFKSKYGSRKSLQPLENSGTLTFPDAGISISVDPLFEFSKAGVRRTYCLWPTQNPPLTQKYGAVACFIMRKAFASSALANSSFYFSDLVSDRTYSEKQVSDNTKLILAADANSIGALLKEL